MAVMLGKILSLALQTDYTFQGCFVLYFEVSGLPLGKVLKMQIKCLR